MGRTRLSMRKFVYLRSRERNYLTAEDKISLDALESEGGNHKYMEVYEP